jgi:filamentous hemagglutinin family protein
MALGAASALVGRALGQTLDAGALPQEPMVVGGNASFAQSGKTLTVTQSSNRTVIDWRSFDIGAAAQTNFNQPDVGSIAVNRVNASADPSRIEGGLHANGQVWILNPNGVLFGKTARVDVAGIVASTATIDTGRFMAGDTRLKLTGADKGSVVNDGAISVGNNGLAAFVAPSVRNSGTISARVGKVTLAAGTTFTLDLAGDQLVEIGLGAGDAIVDQSGKIVNVGGSIMLSARAAGQLVDSVINMSGVMRSASAHKLGGDIVLDGDRVNMSGIADASGTSGGNIAITGKIIKVTADAILRSDARSAGDGGTIISVAAGQGDYAGSYSARGGSVSGNGGKIETSGDIISVAADASIDASATNGNAGTWLLDPLNVTISSGTGGGLVGTTVTTGAIQNALAGGTSVNITTSQSGSGSGDLTLAGSINATSSGNAGLTLEGRHLLATGTNNINIVGGTLTLNVNRVNNTANVSSTWITDALAMIGTVSGGATINLGVGTYTVSSGIINVNKSNITISGAGQSGTLIDARNAAPYGLRISGPNSNVTLQNFTLYGPTGTRGTYGLKAENITNLTLRNIVSRGAARSEFDLNGVIGGTLDNLFADGASIATGAPTEGNGIAFTDSQNITLSNSTTQNNVWGGLALYQANFVTGYTYQEKNITVAASNNFTESNPIYAEDQSATNDFGALTLAGFNYMVKTSGAANDVYAWFQKSQQGAIDYAAANSAANAYVQGYAGNGQAGNNIFTVGISTGGTALSINAAVKGANSGAIINILPGHYTEGVTNVDYLGHTGGDKNFGLYVYQDNITLRGVDASGNRITDPNNAQLPVITPAYQSDFGAQDFISGNNVTIEGLKFLPVATGTNKLLEVIGDNFTLNNSMLDVRGNQTAANIYISDFNLGSGRPSVDNFTIQNNIFYGGSYEGGIVTIASGTGINTDASHRHFENNTLIGSGLAGQRGFQIQGTEPTIPWQQHPTGPVMVLNNTFTNVGIPVRTIGTLTQSLDWNSVLTRNTFTGGAVIIYAADGVTPQVGINTNVYNASTGLYNATALEYEIFSTLQGAFGFEGLQSGNIVHALDGTYVVPGGTYLGINQSITLSGQTQAGTIIDARNALTYGLRVQADNVTLSNFTMLGATGAGGYGIKVEPLDLLNANSRINNFSIDHVTINGANQNTLDLNGAHIASIDHVTAQNAAVGNGIALIDSTNVSVTHSTTLNNALGGVRIEEKNTAFNQQTNAISVDATNTFNESVPIYMEDDSSSLEFGTVAVAGFGFIVRALNPSTDVFTYFRKTQQDAVDYAVNLNLASAYVEGWDGSAVNNIFTVSTGNLTAGGTKTLSIQSAVNGAASGATINVSSGAYAGNVVANARTNFNFGTVALGGIFTLNVGAAGSALSGILSATSISLNAPLILAGATTLDTSTANGSIVTNAIDGATAGGQSLTLNAGTGNVSLGSLGVTTRLAAVNDASTTKLTGAAYNANSLNFSSDVTLTAAITTFDTTQSATSAGDISVFGNILGTVNGAQSLVLKAGSGQGAAVANGNILLQNVGATGLALNGLSVSGNNFGAQTVDLVGDFSSTLLGDQVFSSHTLNAGGKVNGTVGGNASGPINASSSIGLSVSGNLSGAIVGTAIALNAGSISSSTITGSQNISITANSVDSSSLAAPSVDASATTFSTNVNAASVTLKAGSISGSAITGSQNISITANSVGSSSLSAPTVAATATTFSTNVNAANVTLKAGSISGSTITGSQNISITADSVQSSSLAAPTVAATATTFSTNVTAANVTLKAGSISGSTITGSQNISITANSVGSSSLTAPAVAATAASFNSIVNASGTANISGGDIAGTFLGGSFTLSGSTSVNANVVASAANISSSSITGTYSGAAVSLSGSTSVNATVTSSNLTVDSPSGTLAGTWDKLNTGGGGTLSINNETRLGDGSVSPNQLVIENFVLPVGTAVTATGKMVLPEGLRMGLLSPAGSGDIPRLIQVQNVQDLGALLVEGYDAIVIDLSGHAKPRKNDKLSMQ